MANTVGAAAERPRNSRRRAESGTKKKTPFFYVGQGIDVPFLVVLLVLVTIGLICLFSASYVYAYYYEDDSYMFIRNQVIFAVVGLALMFATTIVNYHVWHKLWIVALGISLIALVVVLLLPSNSGIQRWIPLGPINIQPSELAKFAVVLVFSHMMALNYDKMGSFTGGFLPYFGLLAVMSGLMLLEPHLSGTILIFALGFVMMFVGGTKLRYLLITFLIALAGISVMIFVFGYEKDRIDVWLNIEETFVIDRDMAWQTMQSLYAIGSGGLMGQGFGNSRQKHLFLPEPQNDFIFAIVCEEFGFVGAVIIIALFLILLWRGVVIAMHAPDKFGFMFAFGLTMQIALQVALNIAVVTNLLPNTGISLPFFSYGGSSLLTLLVEMGIVLSISRWRTAKT